MHISIEYHSGIPVYKQIVSAIELAVSEGWLVVGERLPSVRALSAELNINPNTTAKAYRELELKGLISSRAGSGSYVLPQQADALLQAEDLDEEEKEKLLRELWEELLQKARRQQVSEEQLRGYINRRRSHG